MIFGEVTEKFENITFEELMKLKLQQIPSNQDKRQSSVIYNAIASNSAETIQMYMDLKFLEDRTYGDTATGIDLDRRASERGIIRYPPSKSICEGIFTQSGNIPFDVPIGSRFSGDDLNYIVVEKIADGKFKLSCETDGEAGNRYFGALIPIEYIKNLATAELTQLLIPGEDAEPDESLRERYFDSFENQAYGGNIADYKLKTNSIQGVGGVKVYPVWAGGGTVKLVIIDSDFNVPSDTLINTVQTYIDPEVNQGIGLGIAPIGHIVTVEPVKDVTVNIKSHITLKISYKWEDVVSGIRTAIKEYFQDLRKLWQKEDTTIVRISRIETRILDVIGVLDVEDTLLNELSANFSLATDEVPILGEVICI